MRILTVIAELGVGGAEGVAVTLATAAAARGHDVSVASAPGHRVVQLREAGVPHIPLQTAGRNPIDLARSLRRLRSTERPDLVHAHNPKASLLGRLAFGRSVPVLTTLHGVSDAEFGHATRILRRASDRVVVVSLDLGRRLECHGFPASRIEVVTNSIVALPTYPRDRARTELGLAPTAVVGLCLARMVDQKRHDLLVDAWASVGGRAILLVGGDGPNRAKVAGAVARLGLTSSIQLLGERSDVPRLLAASDFLVLSSDWEGLPLSVLEALGAGLPVVASRVGGVGEHLTDAVRLVEPGSVAALATALGDVIGDASLRAELGSRARTVAVERLDADRMVAHYLDIYTRLAGSPGAPLTRVGGSR